MGVPSGPPDRATFLASLRDYIEQLREEGIEGLPGTARPPRAPSKVVVARQPAAASVALTSPAPAAASAPPAPATELFYLYPGLERPTELGELREFIGDCQRCKLAPRRINLVFGVGDPHAELMFVGEAPGADEDARG
jgi:hypothetical protein